VSETPGHPPPEGSLERAILEATLAALERDGEAKLRMRDVAEAVGCSVGLLYHHYGDREGLIEAARVRQFEGLLDQDIRTTEAALDACQSAAEFRARLSSLATIGSGPERAEKRRQRIAVLGAAIQRPALLAAVGRVQSDLTSEFQRVLEKGQARGFLDPRVNARALATFMQSYTLGRILSDIDPSGPIPDEDWSELTLKFLLQFT
jgi:TetR/AcrR family transcriptional repressor of bet genes